MDEYTPKMEEANASLFRNAQSALNVLDMVEQTTTIESVREVLRTGIQEVQEAYKEAAEQISHARLQTEASHALKVAMKEGVAVETRQVGIEIKFTPVVQEDVEGTVLAVSYPDGGIDYYPTEIDRSAREYAGDSPLSR